MDKQQTMSRFYDIMVKNDPSEMTNFLLEKGKGPKPICPIMFMDETESKESESNN